MAGRDFSKFVRVMGGATGLADRINTLRDKLDIGAAQRPCNERVVYSWTPDSFPMGWRHWTLAAALDAGLTQDEATALCPELKPAAALAHFIHWRQQQKRVPEAAE
jgi:hypothetical protein